MLTSATTCFAVAIKHERRNENQTVASLKCLQWLFDESVWGNSEQYIKVAEDEFEKQSLLGKHLKEKKSKSSYIRPR